MWWKVGAFLVGGTIGLVGVDVDKADNVDVDPLDSGLLDWIWDSSRPEVAELTATDRVTLARLLSRPCPLCDATVGEWCVTRSGVVLDHLDKQHVARRAL